MQEPLTSRYGFQIEDLQILTDEPGSALLPTSANIKKNFYQMIERAKGGDILLLFFSGHGPFQDIGEGSDSKREEAIVPCDCNLIYSVDFLDMVNHMPERADFVLVVDSCNSGGAN